MFAASNASLPVIQQLVTAGADKGAKDANAQTALDLLNNRLQFQAFLAEQRWQRSGPITLSPTDAAAARHLLTP
jgi:hypothetical protein